MSAKSPIKTTTPSPRRQFAASHLDSKPLCPPWCVWNPKMSRNGNYFASGTLPQWKSQHTGIAMWEVMGNVSAGVLVAKACHENMTSLMVEDLVRNEKAWILRDTAGIQFFLERDIGILRVKRISADPGHSKAWAAVFEIAFVGVPQDVDLFIYARSGDGTAPALVHCPAPQRSMSPASLLMQTLAHGNHELQSQVAFAKQSISRLIKRAAPEVILDRQIHKQHLQQLVILQKENEILHHEHHLMSPAGAEDLRVALQAREKELSQIKAVHKGLLAAQRANVKTVQQIDAKGTLTSVEIQAEDENKRHIVFLNKLDDEIKRHLKSIDNAQTCIQRLSVELSPEKEKAFNQIKETERLMKLLDIRVKEEHDLRKQLTLLTKAHQRETTRKFTEETTSINFLRRQVEQTAQELQGKQRLIIQKKEELQKQEERMLQKRAIRLLAISPCSPILSPDLEAAHKSHLTPEGKNQDELFVTTVSIPSSTTHVDESSTRNVEFNDAFPVIPAQEKVVNSATPAITMAPNTTENDSPPLAATHEGIPPKVTTEEKVRHDQIDSSPIEVNCPPVEIVKTLHASEKKRVINSTAENDNSVANDGTQDTSSPSTALFSTSEANSVMTSITEKSASDGTSADTCDTSKSNVSIVNPVNVAIDSSVADETLNIAVGRDTSKNVNADSSPALESDPEQPKQSRIDISPSTADFKDSDATLTDQASRAAPGGSMENPDDDRHRISSQDTMPQPVMKGKRYWTGAREVVSGDNVPPTSESTMVETEPRITPERAVDHDDILLQKSLEVTNSNSVTLQTNISVTPSLTPSSLPLPVSTDPTPRRRESGSKWHSGSKFDAFKTHVPVNESLSQAPDLTDATQNAAVSGQFAREITGLTHIYLVASQSTLYPPWMSLLTLPASERFTVDPLAVAQERKSSAL